jgi:subfamily B ATP-binding cassette protein MsbA
VNTYLRFFSFLRPYRSRVALAGVVTILFAALSGVSLGMILPVMHVLFSGAGLPGAMGSAVPAPAAGPGGAPVLPGALEGVRHRARAAIVSWFVADTPLGTLERVCVGLLLIFFLKSALAYARVYLNTWLEQAVVRDLRVRLFERMSRLSLAHVQSRRTGEMISLLLHDVGAVRSAVQTTFDVLVRDVLLLVVYLAIVLWVSAPLTLAALAVIPPIFLFVRWLSRSLVRHATAVHERMERVSSAAQETVSGIRVVQAFGMEGKETERFGARAQALFAARMELLRLGAVPGPLAEFLGVVGAVFLLWYGGRQVLAGGRMNADWLMVFLFGMIALMRPVRNLSTVNTTLQEGVAAGRRIFRTIDREPDVRDAPHAREIDRVEREVRFENVAFAYGDGPRVLSGIDVVLARGSCVALVGPSGAGKSTLADLLARFHEPLEGRITVDGVDLREIRLAAWRRRLGVVPQETILFHDTVAANIGYGSPDASQREIEAAARAANADGFITRLPRGYDTLVGDRGVKLSGGERQRIAIARALLRDPDVLILDEATSSLDSQSERLVQEALDRLVANRTTLVIAHRLSTVRHADRIVVLNGGRIVEEGTHETLLAGAGLYRRLHHGAYFRPEGIERAGAGT